MAGEWTESIVGQLAAGQRNALVGGPFGSNLVSRDYVESGVPVIRGQNMGGRWVSGEFVYVSDSKARSLEANLARPGDIVFTQRGTLGQVSIVPEGRFDRYLVSQSQMKLTVDLHTTDPLFIYYVFCAPEQQDYIRQNAIQTGVPHTNLSILRGTPILVPPLAEQRAIAHILGTLDDKIELNRRMSETLEAMARALFKSWFVDFDPVRAKAEGRDPGLPKPLADLFPSRLVDSELGEIPEGWEVDLAGNIFDVAIGKTPPRKEQQWFSTDPLDIPWMSIKDLGQASSFISDVSEYLTADAVERFRVRKIPDGTVVLSFKLTVGRVAITDGAMLSNEAIAHFLPRGTTFLSAAYLYCYLRQFDFNSLGSTSSIATAVNSDSVRAIRVLAPSKEIHEGFLQATSCLFGRLRALQRESRTLAGLRDALLPKLISGDLRVADAAATAEALT
jgi:type I restriction enzyme, S subunit